MVRTLFAVARVFQPSVIFIDEIDSLLTQRTDNENEASRRIKTEFLIQLEGTKSHGDQDRILLIGATNRPQELDEAARRRLVKRLYIPLPEVRARRDLVTNLLKSSNHSLSPAEIQQVAEDTDGFSGADLSVLVYEAALGPVRGIDLEVVPASQVRPIKYDLVVPG